MRAGDDVHLVEARGGNQQVALLDAGLPQHVGARAAAGDELHVEMGETVDAELVAVDEEDVVFGREGVGQRITDVTAPDDDDVHVSRRPIRSF